MGGAVATKKSNDSLISVTDTPARETLEGERKMVTALFGAPVAHEDHPQRAMNRRYLL
jgi:hypothetical protein